MVNIARQTELSYAQRPIWLSHPRINLSEIIKVFQNIVIAEQARNRLN